MKFNKITEIIPDNLPGWAIKAMAQGQLFITMLKRIEDLEAFKTNYRQKIVAEIHAMKIVASQTRNIHAIPLRQDVVNATIEEIADRIKKSAI